MRLGATPTLCISLVAEVLSAFHAAHPAIELHLSETGSRRLLDELAGGELDLALITTSEAARPRRSFTDPLLVEELVVISSQRQRPSTATRHSTLAELVAHCRRSSSARATTCERDGCRLPRRRPHPEVVLEGAEMDAVLRFVERGLGVAIVPAMVLIDRPGLRSVRLAEPPLARTISLAHDDEDVHRVAR